MASRGPSCRGCQLHCPVSGGTPLVGGFPGNARASIGGMEPCLLIGQKLLSLVDYDGHSQYYWATWSLGNLRNCAMRKKATREEAQS